MVTTSFRICCQNISYVDSDDWLEPDFFEKLYAHTNDSDVEMVMCRHERDFHKDLTLFERHESTLQNHYLYIDTPLKRRNYIRATGSMGKINSAELSR